MQTGRSKLFIAGLIGAVVTISTGSAAEPILPNGPRSSDDVAYFEKHVRPLLVQRCYACHSVGSGKIEGGLLLDSRAGWEVGGDSGTAIIPGDVDSSRLIQVVRYEDTDLQMPPDQRLSPAAIAHLERWVRMGAPDPRETAAVELGQRPNPSDPVAGREHWAFAPLMKPATPPVKRAGWPRTAIDRFVLSQLEQAGLPPAPDADRHTLIRRVYFQLTGLPPRPDQVTAFLQDPRPDAYARLVDRLLTSPHLGARWGRHWLDLARYADSNGLDENFLFREAWRYRNWVIEAVNADMPFNRFVLEQIAGDLLSYESIEQRDRQRVAAGLLLVGPKVLLGNDAKKQRMEVADEQLDTIGRAILGQSLGCARCHDHKFDPVPTADYYALAGILTSTQVMQRRYMLGQQRVMERLVGLGHEGDALNAAYEQYWRDLPKVRERLTQAKRVLKRLEEQDEEALASLVTKHRQAVAEEVADPSLPLNARIARQKQHVAKLQETIANPPKIPPRAMIPQEGDVADEFIRLAGQFDRLGERVPRGFLQVLGNASHAIPNGQSGRRELGCWLTDIDDGAGRLAARVLANRVWHHLIGRGIVRTVDNFGRTGESPTHPLLLDYLASELVEDRWSIKKLVRRVVLSRTFTMSSRHDDAAAAVDPENRWLWRAHRRRLEPEALRDAMLLAADQLDQTPMNSSVWYLGDQATAVGDNKVRRRTDFACRSVYLPVIRNDLPELFDAFDFADPHATTGMRPQTMVATQALFALNDESMMSVAEALADSLLSLSAKNPRVRVDALYQRVLSRPARENDQREILSFVHLMSERLSADGDADAERHAWTMACHALLASSRFQILE